ncbi:MAG: hypothetical protein PHC61_01370 [Chitinivibrionales bacterium]|nr:hypothetical protein [Chitinivibrionales bacterium]
MKTPAQACFFLVLTVLLVVSFSNTLAQSSMVNYDTAWTFVYDGGKLTTGTAINDYFYDVKTISDGSSICIGQTADSLNARGVFLAKLDLSGKIKWKNRYNRSGGGNSIVIAKNGDFIIGGTRGTSPLVLRIDTAGNIKWQTWLYDSCSNYQIMSPAI